MSSECLVAGEYPLTFQQWSRLERARQATAESTPARSNLIRSSMIVDGELRPAALRSAAWTVSRRHPALRAAFGPNSQSIAGCDGPPAGIDIGVNGPNAVELPIGAHHRARLYSQPVATGRHRVTLDIDHLVCDGWSINVLWRDLWAAYGQADVADGCACDTGYLAFLRQPAIEPPAGRVTELAELLRAHGSPLGFLDLPTLTPMTEVGTREVAIHSVALGHHGRERIERYATGQKCTPFALLAAAALIAVHRLTGTTRPMFYTYLANRRTPEEFESVGWFASTVLLAAAVDPAKPLAEVVSAVQQLLSEAFADGPLTERVHRATGAGTSHATRPSLSLRLAEAPATPPLVAGLTVRPSPSTPDAPGSVPRGRIDVEVSTAGEVLLRFERGRFAAEIPGALGTHILDALGDLLTDDAQPLARAG